MTTITDTPVLLDSKAVAEILCLSRPSVIRMSREGRLPAPILVGNSEWRWRYDQVMGYLALAGSPV